ncbi:hypothetical protein E1212_05850 [Jiangella ureilytica]|uniref:Uncharacterized protein n=1 Tax=Jiangella ureilytica TaxID=2530374 RepID=A0A4R4RTW2_9ACTN|nr:hypothetical protein [Jiangella ureilytica]TDC53430.1 hypothetical protein E1212_05850 [Jiangella ureilytica]
MANRRDESRRPSARGGRGTGAGRSSSPAPGQQHPPRRRGFWIAVAAVLAAVNIVLATLVLTGGDDSGGDPVAERVAELEAQEEDRHVELVAELTQQTTAAHSGLLPVIEGLHAVVPSGGTAAVSASATPAAWHSAVGAAIGTFGEPPSGSTEFNTARNGLLLAIDLLGSAATAYEAAVAAPAGPQQEELLELAGRLRDQAVAAWSVAATQLDVLNIDAGYGHVHITLPSRPGEEVDPHGGVGFEPQPEDHTDHD